MRLTEARQGVRILKFMDVFSRWEAARLNQSEASMPIEFSPKVPAENSPLRYASIASKATRRLDVGEDIKIEIDDGLESLGGGAVAKAVGQGVAPGGVFGLQGEQFGDCVAPSLWSGASIRRSAIADQR